MTKEQFTKHLSTLVKYKKGQDEIENKMYKSCLKDDFSMGLFGIVSYEELCLKILKDAMEDKDDWISYWIYELNCGKNYKPGTITQNDKDIKLKTINDLYKCIKAK